MRKMISFLILAFVVIVLSTCVYNKEDVLYSNNTSSCDTTNITFKAKVVPILRVNCLRCHSNAVASFNGGGIQLEDYADVKARLDRVYGSMSHQSGYLPMPKDMSNKIDECQIKKVRIWKEAGGLDN